MVPISKGMTPGRRYGHSLVFYKPFLILFGGNLNNEAINDVWTYNSESSPLLWTKLDIKDNVPQPRVYHSAAVCTYGGANGMMVVFGGRRKDGHHLNDMWGLRRHRSGVWDWMKAPFKGTPHDRIQHTSVFCGNFFILMLVGDHKTLEIIFLLKFMILKLVNGVLLLFLKDLDIQVSYVIIYFIFMVD